MPHFLRSSPPAGSVEDPEADEAADDLGVPESIQMPIDGVLDLHTFAPKEAKALVPDYLNECAARGILSVRIIHGKGRGVLRQLVQGVLARHPLVTAFRAADETAGGWGATLVSLRARPR